MLGKETITIDLEGISKDDALRCQHIILRLFTEGFFQIRNGKAVVHFDQNANMRMIEYDFIKWKYMKT